MALPVFDFPYHRPQDEYPAGAVVKFGRGYRFAAKPLGPEEITTHLKFPVMFVYQNLDGSVNFAVDPQLNIFALETFYKSVRMYQPFQYYHHRSGPITARFSKPLVMPRTLDTPGEMGGKVVGGVSYRVHQVEPFDMEILWTQV